MVEGLRGKPVHVPGEMQKPVELIGNKKPGDHFYQAGRLKHIGEDGKVYDGLSSQTALAA